MPRAAINHRLFESLYDGSKPRFRLQVSSSEYQNRETVGRLSELSKSIASDALGFDYCVFADYKLLIADYRGRDNCISGFDEGRIGKNIFMTADGRMQSAAKAFTVSPSFFSEFGVEVGEGEDFSTYKTVAYYDGITVPIVLGNAYEGLYKVGDVIDGADYGTRSSFKCTVTGILPSGSAVLAQNSGVSATESDIVRLDYYALIPFIDFSPLLRETDTSLNAFLSVAAACEGIAIPGSRDFDFRPLSDKYSPLGIFIKPTMVLGASFKYQAKQYFDMLSGACALILLTTVICLTVNLTNKLMSNLRRYAVDLLCGATVADLYGFMIAQTLVITAISQLSALALTAAFGNVFEYSKSQIFSVSASEISPVTVLGILAVGAVVAILSLIVPCVKLAGVEFDTLLREKR